MDKVKPLFAKWRQNESFYKYLEEIYTCIRSIPVVRPSIERRSLKPPRLLLPSSPGYIDTRSLFSHLAPRIHAVINCVDVWQIPAQSNNGSSSMNDLKRDLRHICKETRESEYVNELENSFKSIPNYNYRVACSENALIGRLDNFLHECSFELDTMQEVIYSQLSGSTVADDIAKSAGLSPRVSPIFLLRQLSRDHWSKLSPD